jgi:hypothetical protein
MSKNAKNARKGKSQKGEWGHIGAPPKKTNWPKRPFTMATLFSRNEHQCELSLRNKVDAGVKDGTILELQSKKQAHGAVGRPKSVFVLKENYDKSTMTLATAKVKKTKVAPVSTPVAAAPASVAVAPAAPTTAAPAEAASTTAPPPAQSAPAVSEPVSSPAAETAPAIQPAVG